METLFDDIYLGWKPATSEERYVIGIISNRDNLLTFQYFTDEVAKASRSGFYQYFDFPDIKRTYSQNVLEIFSQRLTPKSRFKTAGVFKFWEITERILHDRLATIAFTQAMLPTDSFEFLADFKPIKGLSFITDLSYTNALHVPGALLEDGDLLTWNQVYGDEESDDKVLIKYEGYQLGYVKKIHANIFKKYKGNFRIRVHNTEKRETLKRVFIKIELL